MGTLNAVKVMHGKAQADRLRTMIFPRALDANKIVVGITYLAAYTLLDWLSLIEPYAQLTITPWNPGTGLSFVLLLVYGRRMIAFVVIAPCSPTLCREICRCHGVLKSSRRC